jgi:hypothetical protein
MLVEAEKLRWLGLDMRPRGRRRVAVVVTYALFLAVVWLNTPALKDAANVYFSFWLAWSLWTFKWEMSGGSWGQGWLWLARAGLIAFAGLVVQQAYVVFAHGVRGHLWGCAVWWMGGTTVWVVCHSSVLAAQKLVDSGDAGWIAKAISHPEKLDVKGRKRLARLGFAVGVDGFAEYKYGLLYEELSEGGKAEIEAMSRANPQGKWMREQNHVPVDDERLRNEENQLRAVVQRRLVGLLVVSALAFSWKLAHGGVVSPQVVVAWAWTLAALAMTLRQASVLWSEDDPGVVAVGELELVEREA